MEEKGQTTTEFALTLPIILLLLFGFFQFILFINAKIILQEAAFQGARVGAVNFKEPQKAKDIAKEIISLLPFTERKEVTVSITNSEIEVKTSAQIRLLPFVREIAAFSGNELIELEAKAVAKKEPYLGF